MHTDHDSEGHGQLRAEEVDPSVCQGATQMELIIPVPRAQQSLKTATVEEQVDSPDVEMVDRLSKPPVAESVENRSVTARSVYRFTGFTGLLPARVSTGFI